MNRIFLSLAAARRTGSSALGAPARLCVRGAFCWGRFPLPVPFPPPLRRRLAGLVGVDPTVVSPGAISITATPIAYSCRDRIGHTDSRVPKSAESAPRSRVVSASLANAAAPVVSESSTC